MASDLYTPLTLPSVLASYTGGPVYTNNGCTVREISSREGTDSAGGSTASITWRVSGSADPTVGRTALFNLGLEPTVTGGPIDNVFDGLGLSSLSRERVADEIWDFTAEYKQREPEPGEFTVSIDTTGGTVRQTYAFSESRYAAPSQTAPDMGKAIDVQDSKPQGVDRVIPSLKINIRAKIKTANVGHPLTYSSLITSLTGTVNNSVMFASAPLETPAFSGFAAGEFLFLGAQGDIVADNPTLNFSFAASPNLTSLTVGDITGITKNGHDFIWYAFKDGIGANYLPVVAPRAAYVNRVYQEADHTLLKIGV